MAFAVPAQAQSPYPPAATCLTLSPTAGPAGTTVGISGDNRTPGSTVSISVDSPVLGTARAGATGSFQARLTIPKDADPGAHTIFVSGASPGCQETAVFQVLAPATPGKAQHDLLGLLEVAAGLVVLGIALVIAPRRRRARDQGGLP